MSKKEFGMTKNGWTRIRGTVCDPTQTLLTQSGKPSSSTELWLHDGHIAASPPPNTSFAEYGFEDAILMSGAIDAHTHIGGGKVNIARLMLPERQSKETYSDKIEQRLGHPLSCPVPSTIETGKRYLQMGYTACFEPAIVPSGARQSHLEMSDTPWVDHGGYLVLGNDDLLLQILSSQETPDSIQEQVNHYVHWMLVAHQCIAIKIVNAGGVHAWKAGLPLHRIDDPHPAYRVTPRQILFSLAKAVEALGIAHPIHVHCNNLGVAGNLQTTLETIQAVEGLKIHLTHLQFHAFSTDTALGYASGAQPLAERINQSPNISIDIGQVLFGQTVTISADLQHQFANRNHAHPKKVFFQEIECQSGCGVVPFRYRRSQYVHSLQWAIGLELFLLIKNPWQVFLTTDHPNGAPFTTYPHLIRLLMDYEFRMSCFEHLHEDAKSRSILPQIKREYTFHEIAIITRAAPARSLGLSTIGSLREGCEADVVVYDRTSPVDVMFANPKLVFRHGELVCKDGEFLKNASKTTYVSAISTDILPEAWLSKTWKEVYQQRIHNAQIQPEELVLQGTSSLQRALSAQEAPCLPAANETMGESS